MFTGEDVGIIYTMLDVLNTIEAQIVGVDALTNRLGNIRIVD
jgi:hypothetical protein